MGQPNQNISHPYPDLSNVAIKVEGEDCVGTEAKYVHEILLLGWNPWQTVTSVFSFQHLICSKLLRLNHNFSQSLSNEEMTCVPVHQSVWGERGVGNWQRAGDVS